MRIALIGNEFCQQFPVVGYGGIESCVEQLAWGLSAAEHDFFVVVPRREKKTKGKNQYPFEIVEVPFRPSLISGKKPGEFIRLVKKALKGMLYDAIWSQSHWSLPPLLELGRPIIATFHDSCLKQAGWMINHPNAYHRFISKFQYRNWVRLPWEREKSFQVYTGMADEEYDFGAQRDDYFLWVAGFNFGWDAKGLPLFIELARQNPGKNFIAYGGGDKTIQKKLIKTIRNIPNLSYRGELKHGIAHRETFKKARAFIMPTRLPEALGRTILESLSKGTPVLGSANGALPEIIQQHGIATNNFSELNCALEQPFDNQACFEYSKSFSVRNEVRAMLDKTKAILAGVNR
ncbi:MAG: glycosyltransferase family 4 protein [Chitinivibrionales bacterium]|nr:glycosyltransferase family 4 protein [Chitinivibrionales bacterium]